MFKSLSRSTRPPSQSSSSAYTLNASSTSSYTPLPPLSTIPPTPERSDRDIPAARIASTISGKSPGGSPILEKRRTRTLVPRRAVLNKENRPQSENPFIGSLRAAPAPAAVDATTHVAGFAERQRDRHFHSAGPSTGLSFTSPVDPSSSSQGSLKANPIAKHKRVLVESRTYADGGQVEVVKETIGRSSKPILGSVKGTLAGTLRGGTVRNENGESVVVKKKKSRGTLDSIRWALGDRTNAARKAEKEKDKEEKEGRKSQESATGRPKAKLTIDTQVPREDPSETSATVSASVTSPASTMRTSGTITGVTTDNESLAAASGGEKTKWRWTIGKKSAKSPGATLSSMFERPGHARTNSLDPSALMAMKHTESPEEEAAQTTISPRPSSLNLPNLLYNATADSEAEGSHSTPPPRPTPVQTAPVDFGFEPRTVRKGSTGSIESHAGSGTTRKSSIGSILKGSGAENAANTGSFAVRTMRSIRSITSLARLGGWSKGEEDGEPKDKEEKKKLTIRKKRRVKKKAVQDVEEELTTSGESWEAGALGHDPTITAHAPIGQPISRENLRLKDGRVDLGLGSRPLEWAREGRRSSSGSSCAAPSTISSGSYHQSRMSRASSEMSSEGHTTRSRLDSVPTAPNVPPNPSIIFEQPEEVSAPTTSGPSSYLGDNAWVGAGANTLKNRTRRTEHIGGKARKPIMGLFDVPPTHEAKPSKVDSPPHVEVRGVKIDKGRVRDRIKAFEAKAEEHVSASGTYPTISLATGRRPSLPVLSADPTTTTFSDAISSAANQSLTKDREHTFSSVRCVSAPLPPKFAESPERPTRTRPWSEQVLRPDPAAIDMLNAANSDLSDLINRLDLTFTPEAKSPTPNARRVPAWVEDSPSRQGPRGQRTEESIFGSLKAYSQSTLAKPSSRVTRATSDLMDLFAPLDAAPIRGQLFPGPGASKPSNSTITKSSSGSGRTRIESRRGAGMRGTLGELSMSVVEGGDGSDSDIPQELQVILAGGSDDEGLLPSPGMPPDVPLPEPAEAAEVPRVVIEDTTETQVVYDFRDAEEQVERGSRKSFDFTEELGQLKGGSRNSFVEVLVTAFKTPARAGASAIEDQLELSLDSFNSSAITQQDNKADDDEIATEAEISNSRAEALAKLTQKSSDRLNQEFKFSAPADTSANRSQEVNPTSTTPPFTFTLPTSTQAQSNLGTGTVRRRDFSIRFEVDASEAPAQASTVDVFSASQKTTSANVPSISSFNRMLNPSQEELFDYETLMRELDEASGMMEESTRGLERSVSRRRRSKRLSMESDRSSFHCRTNAPPVSFHNRGFGRQSTSSLGGRSAWARYGVEDSTENFTTHSFDRPGLGDKMFQMGVEHGLPLPSIMASPTNSEVSTDPQFYYEQPNHRFSYVSDNRRNSYISERRNSYAPSMVDQKRMSFMSYDSLVDGAGDERRYSIDMNSLYERRRTNSTSSVSIFGDDRHRRRHNRTGPYPSQYRPVSIISMQSDISARDDDTMVSMIGGHGGPRVRRKSVGSTLLLDASPCFRAEKRAKQVKSDSSRMDSMNMSSLSLFQSTREDSQDVFSSDSILDGSPGKGKSRATPRPFARPRPPAAVKMANEDEDEDEMEPSATPQMLAPYSSRPLTVSCRKSRPMGNMTMSIARNRSSALICTAEPPDTPPLSIAGSDASSISGGSQSSIDVSKLAGMLGDSDVASPSGRRSRARGQGHRRRSQISRTSMAISFTAEDLQRSDSYSYSQSHSGYSNSQINHSVMIVDPDEELAELAEMIEAGIQLSDEHLASVTRYCALRNEAIETVERSQKIWEDTDFSRFALSTFVPPTNPSAIQEMLSHSQDTYAALPTEFYKRRHSRYARTPRISPYPTDVTRSAKSSRIRLSTVEQALSHLPPGYTPVRPTRHVPESPFVHSSSPAPTLGALAPLSPLSVNLESKPAVIKEKSSKQSLTSTVRRTALGWGKKKVVVDAPPSATKTHVIQSSAATVAKENMGVGMLASPSQNTLRMNRPRPKGRTAGSTLRTALRI
ncbi:muscle M-line assembly protein unc-89 [Ceratobasidium sp. AG-Ba]|nr:muscle M-line assembly protein unc-89 [Ceratobasidium sp. AG-Ba]